MKVAIIVPEPYSPVYGGALATWTYQVYRLLCLDVKVIAKHADDCYDIPQFFSYQTNTVAKFFYHKIRNRSFKGLLQPIKQWLNNSDGRSAANLCRSLNSEVIHIHNSPNIVLPVKRLNPKSYIILHMNNDHLIGGDNPKELDKIVTSVDRIAFCSEYIRQNALNHISTLKKEKTFLIANGADDIFQPSAIRQFTEDPRLLFVGRIVPEKGLHVLLEAFETISHIYPQATLRVVGGITFGSDEESEYFKSIKTKASTWGDRVVFVGPVPHDRIATEFARADLFVCPSIWQDPLPTVNAEAMACGLPIVAFDRGGIPEIVGDAGILVPEISAPALAEAIDTVLSDAALRQRLSENGIRRVSEKFSWQAISQVWLQQLQELKDEPQIPTGGLKSRV
jgi:glycosyltransferase involved in cell wall biosynthesis